MHSAPFFVKSEESRVPTSSMPQGISAPMIGPQTSFPLGPHAVASTDQTRVLARPRGSIFANHSQTVGISRPVTLTQLPASLPAASQPHFSYEFSPPAALPLTPTPTTRRRYDAHFRLSPSHVPFRPRSAPSMAPHSPSPSTLPRATSAATAL